jgi:hypothetical protein
MEEIGKIPCKFPVAGNSALETGFAGLHPPPSSPTKPQIPAPTPDRPFSERHAEEESAGIAWTSGLKALGKFSAQPVHHRL